MSFIHDQRKGDDLLAGLAIRHNDYGGAFLKDGHVIPDEISFVDNKQGMVRKVRANNSRISAWNKIIVF